MEKCRNVRIGEDVWARLKQRALDERVTLREVVERAVHQYLGPAGSVRPDLTPGEAMQRALESRLDELGKPARVRAAVETHWTKDDDVP